MRPRALLVLLIMASGVALAGGTAAAASPPRPITVPGGLTPAGRSLAAADTVGDCELDAVACRPPVSGSCTGNTSQIVAPSSIRVLVRTGTTTTRIDTVPFQTYVENVLPNEWVPSWDGDALKAGAVAVKSYAWYWATHYGGYVGSSPSSSGCFDVTDDADFQVYKAGSAVARTTQKVADTWPVVARRNGQVVQTLYRAYLSSPGEACGAGSDGTTLSQYGSQNCNEASSGYKYNVILKLYYGQNLDLSTVAQLRTQHDFAFMRTSTAATYSAGSWAINDGYPTTFSFGLSGDIPLVTTGGDGFAGLAVWRPSTCVFYFAGPTGAQTGSERFGLSGDRPVPAQYDGLTSPTRVAVWRPGNGTWYFAGPNGVTASTTQWGLSGDVPVPGRWTSADTDSIAVWRPTNGTWYLPGRTPVQWGLNGDIPVPADYNGDGITDFAVYRPSNHTFYLRGGLTAPWGVAGDVPVTGDFNGDGSSDLAIYRPSTRTWWVRGGATFTFGTGTPIGAAPYFD